jgi:hypothetical protein
MKPDFLIWNLLLDSKTILHGICRLDTYVEKKKETLFRFSLNFTFDLTVSIKSHIGHSLCALVKTAILVDI